jgi:hypothetical protein
MLDVYIDSASVHKVALHNAYHGSYCTVHHSLVLIIVAKGQRTIGKVGVYAK